MAKKTTIAAATVLGIALTLIGASPAEAAYTKKPPPPAPNLVAQLLALLSPPPPPTTVAPTPTTTVPVQNLDVGASGPAVKLLEDRLDALHYFVGAVDSTYDDDTFQAVMAFQKVNNLPRTGTVNSTLWSAMQTAKDPQPLVGNGGSQRVEVDLGRQILFLYNGGKLAKIIAVSSGTGDTPTPTGDYRIYSKSVGWETSALGQLYNSQYFVGGYAIHGSRSVPSQPASHGCVRIPMTAADWFPDQAPIGTPVYIR
jgi:lipoprotein-anchoring transpeptidase ErfK/SrfK